MVNPLPWRAQGTQKLWRIILGGQASARFHRPGALVDYYGVGLNKLGQTHIRSARMLENEFNIFGAIPDKGQ